MAPLVARHTSVYR